MTAMIPRQGAAPPGSDPLDLLDAVACGVLAVEAGDVVTYANPDAVALLDLEHGEGRGVEALLAALARAAADPRLDGSGAPGRLAVRVELAPRRTVECVARPLGDGRSLLTLVDVTPQVEAMQLAQRDPLTGLANRTALRDRLGALLGGGEDVPVAVLCVDLDRFKAVNDTLGHPMGDALLVKVAERLRASVRADDVVARMGGDEFTILHVGPQGRVHAGQPAGLPTGLPAGGVADRMEDAAALASRLVDLVGRSYLIEGRIINVGASVGLALAPMHGRDPDELLKRADLALYQAKASGRGTHRFFEPGLDGHLQARRTLEIELRKALALREFALAYQPQVTSETQEVCGFEALLQWNHPRLGTVPPAEFMPLAEELGLIVPIGEWALRTACGQAARWPAPTWVSLNLSPAQLRSPRLVESVAAALAAAALDPSRLEIEVAEGTLVGASPGLLDVLGGLRALGVRVSMDDFGTGYSSLGSLQKFSFDRIKIDESFVRGPEAGQSNRAIVRAITSLGASLGMRTTAEGVETVEQFDRMRLEGCTEVQGLLTGSPLPAEAATALLRSAPLGDASPSNGE